MKVGLSPFGLSMSLNFLIMLNNWQCIRYGGASAVATYAILSYVLGSVQPPFERHRRGHAAAGKLLLRRARRRGAQKSFEKGLALMLATCAALCAAIVLLRGQLPYVFGASPQTAQGSVPSLLCAAAAVPSGASCACSPLIFTPAGAAPGKPAAHFWRPALPQPAVFIPAARALRCERHLGRLPRGAGRPGCGAGRPAGMGSISYRRAIPPLSGCGCFCENFADSPCQNQRGAFYRPGWAFCSPPPVRAPHNSAEGPRRGTHSARCRPQSADLPRQSRARSPAARPHPAFLHTAPPPALSRRRRLPRHALRSQHGLEAILPAAFHAAVAVHAAMQIQHCASLQLCEGRRYSASPPPAHGPGAQGGPAPDAPRSALRLDTAFFRGKSEKTPLYDAGRRYGIKFPPAARATADGTGRPASGNPEFRFHTRRLPAEKYGAVRLFQQLFQPLLHFLPASPAYFSHRHAGR